MATTANGGGAAAEDGDGDGGAAKCTTAKGKGTTAQRSKGTTAKGKGTTAKSGAAKTTKKGTTPQVKKGTTAKRNKGGAAAEVVDGGGEDENRRKNPKPKRKRKRRDTEEDSDSSSGEDDGIVIDNRLVMTKAVLDLDNDCDYQQLRRRTIKSRREDGTQARFQERREPIRSSAAAARAAYVEAREATPDTPDVREMLRSKNWETVVSMKNTLEEKGWFNPPQKKSIPLCEPACAWYTAGKQPNSLRHKFLPCLHKDVVRNAVQDWVKVHFYLPVAGINKQDQHKNFMEMFVTFVWGFYTQNQKPKVPALTNVGRFTFTYIWRKQHDLVRYFPRAWPR